MAFKKIYDYEEDRIWDWFKKTYNIDLSQFASPDDLESYIDKLFNEQPKSGEEGKGGLGSFGDTGRRLVKETAVEEYESLLETEIAKEERKREVEREKKRKKVELEERKEEKIEVEELPTPRVRARPEIEEPRIEEPRIEEPKVREPEVKVERIEQPRVGEPKVEEPKIEKPKVEKPTIGNRIANFTKSVGNRIANVGKGIVNTIRKLFGR